MKTLIQIPIKGHDLPVTVDIDFPDKLLDMPIGLSALETLSIMSQNLLTLVERRENGTTKAE